MLLDHRKRTQGNLTEGNDDHRIDDFDLAAKKGRAAPDLRCERPSIITPEASRIAEDGVRYEDRLPSQTSRRQQQLKAPP